MTVPLRKRIAWSVVGAGVALVVGVVVVTILNIRVTQQHTAPKIDTATTILQRLNHLVHRIDSCTSTTGGCAKRGRAQQAHAIAGLLEGGRQTAAAAAACAAHIPRPDMLTVDQRAALIYRCMADVDVTPDTP